MSIPFVELSCTKLWISDGNTNKNYGDLSHLVKTSPFPSGSVVLVNKYADVLSLQKTVGFFATLKCKRGRH